MVSHHPILPGVVLSNPLVCFKHVAVKHEEGISKYPTTEEYFPPIPPVASRLGSVTITVWLFPQQPSCCRDG